MPDINKAQLLRHIAASDLTAVEKRYLEELVGAEDSNKNSNKIGRWIKGSADGDGYHCSKCGIWKRHIGTLKYCPHCGAKMDGDD